MLRDARIISQTRTHGSVKLYIEASGPQGKIAVYASCFAYTSQFQKNVTNGP